jgi:hypothetical protein
MLHPCWCKASRPAALPPLYAHQGQVDAEQGKPHATPRGVVS